LARDLFNICATHLDLFDDVRVQNGRAYDRIFATFIEKPIFNNYNQKSGIKKETINQHKTTEKRTNKQTTAATITAPTKAVSISSIPFLLIWSVNLLRLGSPLSCSVENARGQD